MNGNQDGSAIGAAVEIFYDSALTPRAEEDGIVRRSDGLLICHVPSRSSSGVICMLITWRMQKTTDLCSIPMLEMGVGAS